MRGKKAIISKEKELKLVGQLRNGEAIAVLAMLNECGHKYLIELINKYNIPRPEVGHKWKSWTMNSHGKKDND